MSSIGSCPTACQQAQSLLHLNDIFRTLLRSSSLSSLLCRKILKRDVYTSCPPFFTSFPLLGQPVYWGSHHSLQQCMRYTGDKEKNLMAKHGDFCPSVALADHTAAEHWAVHPCLELVIDPVFAFSLTLRISSFLHPQPHLFLRSFHPLNTGALLSPSLVPFLVQVHAPTRFIHSLGGLYYFYAPKYVSAAQTSFLSARPPFLSAPWTSPFGILGT